MSDNNEISNPSEKNDAIDFKLEPNITICKNCESEHDIAFEFCPHCGQKTNEDLTVGVLFYNTIANYFSFDARFFRSFIPLMLKPGVLAKRFVSGKRLMYLHPAQMYLFISVVFFFMFSFTVRKQTDSLNQELRKTIGNSNTTLIDSVEMRKEDSLNRIEIRNALQKNKFLTGMTDEDIDSIVTLDTLPKKTDISFGFNEAEIDSLINANASDEEIYKTMGLEEDDNWFVRKLYTQALKFYKSRDGGNILKAFYDYIPISLFFLLPIFAMILKVFFWRRGTFAHHLVFSFYYFSFLFVTLCILIGVNYFIDIPDWLDWLVVMSTFFYLVFAMRAFYQQGFIVSFLKASVASFIYMIFVVPIAAFIMLGLSFMFY